MVAGQDPVLVFLDDDHNRDHVYRELIQYAVIVSIGSYLVVADTIFGDLPGTPIVKSSMKYPDVQSSDPRLAVRQFLSERCDFVADPRHSGTGFGNFPDGFLRRTR